MKANLVPLKELVSRIESGVSPVCEERSPAPGEAGVLTLAAITSGAFLPEEAKAIAAEKIGDNWTTPVSGSILITRASGSKGLVGACALVDVDRGDRIVPDTAWQLRFDLEDAPPAEWVLEYLKSPGGRRQILRAARGSSGIFKITKGSVGRLQVPIPDARVLGTVVNLVRAVNRASVVIGRLIDRKRAFKRALMNDLLTGRRRFPEFEGPPWIRRSLGDFLHEKTLRNSGGRVQLVYSCSKLYGIIPQADRFKHRVAARNVDNYKVVSQGDLVYDPMLLWDASLGFVPDGADGVVSPAYTTLALVGSEVDRGFLAHALFSHRACYLYKTVSRGTNVRRKKVLASDFLRITLPVPPTLAEQQRVAELLDRCDTEIRNLAEQAAPLAALKRGLMQRLLAGEIKLPKHLTAASAATEETSDDS